MATFNMFIGISGSGKTYVAKQRTKFNSNEYIFLDSDAIRGELYGDEGNQEHNDKVFSEMLNRSLEALRLDKDVYYVATNLSSKRRINLIKQIKTKYPNTKFECTIVMAPLDICKERNMMRERHVPEYVIDRQVRSFDPPYKNEGWDVISITWNFYNDNIDALYDRPFKNYNEEYNEIIKEYGSQQNSHHQLSLYEHCKKCGCIAYEKEYSFNVIQACYIHDYGKAFTGIKWEKDNYKEMHYPNHAELGSYLALIMHYNLNVAQLVRFHMIPYMDEHAQQTWRQRLGEELWNEIIQIHECDELAH